jgi:uracil-DNA glycosylase
MQRLLSDIRSCTFCKNLPHGYRPIIQASPQSIILIIGQAPGRKVHETGIPWDDPSGRNLRKWLGVTDEQFYNPDLFALMPMGFCYPGSGKSGDLPPRPECAPLWHQKVLDELPSIQLTLLFGQYAQQHYLGNRLKENLTETVKNFKEYLPDYLPLPHPSPRNGIWLKKNEWFQLEVLPELKRIVKKAVR